MGKWRQERYNFIGLAPAPLTANWNLKLLREGTRQQSHNQSATNIGAGFFLAHFKQKPLETIRTEVTLLALNGVWQATSLSCSIPLWLCILCVCMYLCVCVCTDSLFLFLCIWGIPPTLLSFISICLSVCFLEIGRQTDRHTHTEAGWVGFLIYNYFMTDARRWKWGHKCNPWFYNILIKWSQEAALWTLLWGAVWEKG